MLAGDPADSHSAQQERQRQRQQSGQSAESSGSAESAAPAKREAPPPTWVHDLFQVRPLACRGDPGLRQHPLYRTSTATKK